MKNKLDLLGSALTVAGGGAVSGGCWMIWPPLGLLAIGAGLLVLGLAICKRAGGMRDDR